MPLKTTPITATALRLAGNTNISNADSQVVIIEQLQKIVDQLIENGLALKNKINELKILKVKILLVKRFIGKKLKFKEFLI